MTRTRALTLAALTAALVAPLTACQEDYDVRGAAAIQRGADGSPVLLVRPCGVQVDRIDVSAGREGLSPQQTNPTLATLTTSPARTAAFEVDLAAPRDGWTQVVPFTRPSDGSRLMIVGIGSDKKLVPPVTTTMDTVAGLAPGEVVSGDGARMTTEEFEKKACATK